uniref:hypothetical protein n=1 Tax=Helicobacter typhlonius TaxID=76936 RepID=UPI002FE37E12
FSIKFCRRLEILTLEIHLIQFVKDKTKPKRYFTLKRCIIKIVQRHEVQQRSHSESKPLETSLKSAKRVKLKL